jgi:hypothetical protein
MLPLQTVLEIRDILVRIWIPGFVPLANGSGSTPDPAPLFNDLKDVKILYSYFFHITYPQVHHLLS